MVLSCEFALNTADELSEPGQELRGHAATVLR